MATANQPRDHLGRHDGFNAHGMRPGESPPGVASWRWRRVVLLAISGLLITDGQALGAVIALTVSQFDVPIVATKPDSMDDYSAWAADCQNVHAGQGCSMSGRPNLTSGDRLLSWGLRGDSNNSLIRIEYTGNSGVQLNGVRVSSAQEELGPDEGPRYPEDNPVQFAQDSRTGTGSMVIYEKPSTNTFPLAQHLAEEQRFGVELSGGSRLSTETGDDDMAVLQKTGSYVGTDATGANYIRDMSFDTEYVFNTPITLQQNDIIFLRFFESTWDNSIFFGLQGGAPDAYYGSMQVELLSPLASGPSISVETGPGVPATPTLPLFARAGSGEDATARLSVTNTGEAGSTLTTQFSDFYGIPYANARGGLTASPASSQAEESLAVADDQGTPSMDRGFTLTPATELAWDTSPNPNGTHGIFIGPSAQSITHNDPGETSPIEIGVMGTTVGPVLGLTTGTNIPMEIAARTPYGGTINIGELEVGGGEIQRDLLLANVFGERIGDLTTLTVSIIGIGGVDSSYFCFVLTDGSCNPGSAYPIDADGQRFLANDPNAGNDTLALTIRFLGTNLDPGRYTADLYFLTDMNRSFGLSANRIDFPIAGSIIASGIPIPTTVWLFSAGVISLLVSRRRQPRRLLETNPPNGAGF